MTNGAKLAKIALNFGNRIFLTPIDTGSKTSFLGCGKWDSSEGNKDYELLSAGEDEYSGFFSWLLTYVS